MRRTLTAEETEQRNERRKQTIEARRASAAARRITVGRWVIYRLDPSNVVLEHDGDEGTREYYPDYEWAIKSLLSHRIEHHAAATLTSWLEAIETARGEVLAALRE